MQNYNHITDIYGQVIGTYNSPKYVSSFPIQYYFTDLIKRGSLLNDQNI